MKDALQMFKIWWQKPWPRPLQMLLTVLGTVLIGVLVDKWTGWHVYDRLFYPAQKTPADVQAWSALIYALALIGGLPVAFLVWHWRDVNKRAEIENTRKDINLKEFQEVQLRAAGALDVKLPQEARQQMQIAALHQLRGFLRGAYGESFKRPAFEFLLAGHAAAIERIGVPRVQAGLADRSQMNVREAILHLSGRLTQIDRARMLIIRDEITHIFLQNFPLDGRRFDFIDLSEMTVPKNLNMSSSHFFGANLYKSCFSQAKMTNAHFEGSYLRESLLENLDLQGAHFQGADLRWAVLRTTDFFAANLEGTDFRRVQFDGETDFDRATFNAATKLGGKPLNDWGDLSESEKEAARAPWIALGMINVDAPQPESADDGW